jgi:hypothetical protein
VDIVGFHPEKGVVVSPGRGDGTFEETERIPYEFVREDLRFLVDTNGNGRVDIVGFRDDGVWVSLQDDNNKFTPPGNKPVIKAFGRNDEAGAWRVEKHPRFLVDTTGNKRVDIVGFHDDGVWVSLQDDNGKFAEPRFVVNDFGINQGWTSVKEHPRFLVKTTSDGHVDIIGFGSQGVVISRGNGDGGFQKAELVLNDFGSAQSWTGEKHLRYLADTTGDGHIDIIGFGDEGVWVSHGHGNGEFGQAQLTCRGFGYTKEAGGWRIDRHPRFLIDTTGNGRLDIVGFGGPGVYVARNLVRQFVTRNP